MGNNTSGIVGCGALVLLAIGGMIYGVRGCNSSMERETQKAKERFVQSNQPVCVVVQEELHGTTTVRVPRQVVGHDGWSGEAIYSPETQVPTTSYTLLTQREETKAPLAISVIDGGDKRKESLDALISRGSRICFPVGNILPNGGRGAYQGYGFSHDQDETYVTPQTATGTKRANRIRVE